MNGCSVALDLLCKRLFTETTFLFSVQYCMYRHVFDKPSEHKVIQKDSFISSRKFYSVLSPDFYLHIMNIVQRSANLNLLVIFNPTQQLLVLIKSTHAHGSNSHQGQSHTKNIPRFNPVSEVAIVKSLKCMDKFM